jgi:hypothetical protein
MRIISSGAVCACLACALWALPPGAYAATPAPDPGAPAVESAPASLVGLDPTLPAGVVSSSEARGSRWQPEKAVYGTGSENDIALQLSRTASRSTTPSYRTDGIDGA